MRTFFSMFAALTIAAAPLPAKAQAKSWLELLNPDRLAEGLIQYGILAARTQVDLTYSALTVDILAGRAVLTDLEVYPLPDWDDESACVITVDRVVLNSAPAGDIDNLKFRISLYGLDTHRACFPPDSWPMFAMLGLVEPSLPHVTVSLDYNVPSAGARIDAHFVANDLMAIDLAAEFDYLWFDGSQDIENPEPVVLLSSSTLSVENLGVWGRVANILPPTFRDPTSAPSAIEGLLASVLGDMNPATGNSTPGTQSQLNNAQREFISSAATAWGAFLSDPQRLILETQIDPNNPEYLDFVLWEDQPSDAFEVLAPRVSNTPSAAAEVIPVNTIRQVLSSEGSNLSSADKLSIGRALVSGIGAPRNLNAGVNLLRDLARNGDAEAASALSEALEIRDPINSYGWTLIAASAGMDGASARLDRLERSLPFADVLNVQEEVQGDQSHPVEPLKSVAAVKAEARARLTGRGLPRNYLIAAMWAMIAKAAGDSEGAALLDEIDQRVARADPEAMQAWSDGEARASELAMEAWIGQDLPARFGAE